MISAVGWLAGLMVDGARRDRFFFSMKISRAGGVVSELISANVSRVDGEENISFLSR